MSKSYIPSSLPLFRLLYLEFMRLSPPHPHIKLQQILIDLLVGFWLKILCIGNKLSPNVIPEGGGDSVDQ